LSTVVGNVFGERDNISESELVTLGLKMIT